MPGSSLTPDDCTRVLVFDQLVRVAFRNQKAQYLIPLGYVWLSSALYGVADPGRKTEMASRDPTVAFQVDTAMRTGLWEWEIVAREGVFELVYGTEKQAALEALQPVLANAPDWWRREQGPRMAAGALVVWRIRPAHIAGFRYSPGNGGSE